VFSYERGTPVARGQHSEKSPVYEQPELLYRKKGPVRSGRTTYRGYTSTSLIRNDSDENGAF